MCAKKKTDDPEIQKLTKNLHAGHRQRMRRRFLTTGLHSFEDYEVLEMLLFYAVPRRNTNETAHMLIRRFGSLSGVLDATEQELQTVPGVGPNSAKYLRLLQPLALRLGDIQKQQPAVINCTRDVRTALGERLVGRTPPMLCLLLLSATNTVLGARYFPGDQIPSVRSVVASLASTPANRLVLVQWNLSWDSNDQLIYTQQQLCKLASALRDLEFSIWDCYTFSASDEKLLSCRHRGQLVSF